MPFPKPKRCKLCHQVLDKTPVKWCIKCQNPILLHHKWKFTPKGLEHKDCKNPSMYPDQDNYLCPR